MNIFVTSAFSRASAEALDDVRLRKMILETAQMAATALRERFGIESQYKTTHKNHPCNKWAREATYNLHWLIVHGLDLSIEYTYRFGKTHKSSLVLHEQWELFSRIVYDEMKIFEEMTPFQNSARNDRFDFTHLPVPDSYRCYLNAKWTADKKPPKWTRRGPPIWADEMFHTNHERSL